MPAPGSSLVRLAPSGRPATGPSRRARRRIRRLVPVVAALSVLPFAAYAEERVALEVGTILATTTTEHVDAQLATVQGQLERLSVTKGYTSYRLVKQEKSEVSCGNPASFEIPGGRRLEVMAKDTRGGRVSLNLALMKDRHTLMRTDLTLGKRGTIMVGGPRYEDGVLIIWIGARRMGAAGAGNPAP